jgi:hypothetical protein
LLGAFLALLACLSAVAQDEESQGFVRFANRSDCVEVERTRAALDLSKPFTIEMWARWTPRLDMVMSLAADEMWPGMSDRVPATAECGWIIRASRTLDADKHALEFTVAGSNRRKRDWFHVTSGIHREQPDRWQHIAVSRSMSVIRLYWNGKEVGRRPLAGVTLHGSPSNVFLGMRREGYKDREFTGDIAGFHMTAHAKYTETFKPEMPIKKDEATVVLLDFDAATEQQVPDVSGFKRHATISGAKLIKPKK